MATKTLKGKGGGEDTPSPTSLPRKLFHNFESVLASLLILAGLVLFLVGMVMRALTPQIPSGWTGEITIYLVVWGLLVAACDCVARREHIRVDLIVRLVGPRWRRHIDLFSAVCGLIFSILLCIFGWQVVGFALRMDERSLTMLQTPQYLYYAALPCSLALASVRYLLDITQRLRAREREL
ncbi:MAG: TRAP transporter small permease [Pseudomonadota bacterium]